MSQDHETVAAYLELIAAKAKQLATDYKAGRLWGGELGRGLDDIAQTIRKIDTRTDR
jgi:hypothetical protein